MVASILEQFGWEPADVGSTVAARALEPLARHGFRGLGWRSLSITPGGNPWGNLA